MRSAKEIAKMSDEERRRLRLRRVSGKYRKKPRPDFSRQQLVSYLRRKGFRSCRELDKGRRGQEPSSYDYRKEFGSWKNALEAVYGSRPPAFESATSDDPEFYGKLVVQLDLWRKADWESARQKMPEVVPSINQVRRKFGRYSNLVEYARRLSLASALNRYLVLSRRLGRVPSLKDCQRDGVSIEAAVEHFGSKKAMDEFIANGGLVNADKGRGN